MNKSIKKFFKFKYNEALIKYSIFESKRLEFVSKYKINIISGLTLEEYVNTENKNNSSTFCGELEELFSLYPNAYKIDKRIFGIYMDERKRIRLESKFFKTFNSNYVVAFKHLKSVITNYLSKTDGNVLNNVLDTSFSMILRYIYYPNTFFPVVSNSELNLMLEIVGKENVQNKPLKIRVLELIEYKSHHKELKNINNYVFVEFCNYVYKKKEQELIKNLKKDFNDFTNELDEKKIVGEERESLIKARVNHSYYKKILMNKYSECCFCNIKTPGLLIASHIKPWHNSSPEEKVDADNGFLLCPFHDKLFDCGYISVDDDGYYIISRALNRDDIKFVKSSLVKNIRLNENLKQYCKYHREKVLKKSK